MRPLTAGSEEGGLSPQSLNALIVAVANTRDRAAFKLLFDHFGPRLKGYMIRLGTAPQQAEDLAQEAMLLVWRKAHLFDASKASASTWIFTLARNLRIDAVRRERRPEIDPGDLAPEPERDADSRIMLEQNSIRLKDALKDLPPDQMQVVELSFFGDKPHSVIADELMLPLGTVKSRLRLAMMRLKQALEDDR